MYREGLQFIKTNKLEQRNATECPRAQIDVCAGFNIITIEERECSVCM